MKKVFYAVTRVGKTENVKMSGMGFITDTDLVIACMSKANKPYVKVFQDVVQCCHPMVNKADEFNGAYYEIRQMEFAREDGSKETREIEVNYYIWYKLID